MARRRYWISALVPCALALATTASAQRGTEASLAAAATHEAPGDVAERLLGRWAPTFVQHVASGDRGRDRPTRIDFDGDWRTDDNWDEQARFGWRLPVAAYGAAVLTDSHAFLTYTLYYPRDWAEPLCAPLLCHDNDLENLRVVIELGGPGEDGRVAWLESKAHLGFREVAGADLALDEAGRPLARVEAGGHGIQPCRRDDAACRPEPGRLVYALGDAASAPPRRARGQTVRYELLSLRDALWARRSASQPGSLWSAGETGPLWYAGQWSGRLGLPLGAALRGRRFVAGSVRPPWAVKGRSGRRGDWFLDPAAAELGRRPELAGRLAPRYTFNPFLDELRAECVATSCPRVTSPLEQARQTTWGALGALGLALMASLRVSHGRLRRYARSPRWWRRR